VQHIGAFAQLHDKIGDLGVSARYPRSRRPAERQAEEQTKVIQAITSVIQALPAVDAIGPVEASLADSFYAFAKLIPRAL